MWECDGAVQLYWTANDWIRYIGGGMNTHKVVNDGGCFSRFHSVESIHRSVS